VAQVARLWCLLHRRDASATEPPPTINGTQGRTIRPSSPRAYHGGRHFLHAVLKNLFLWCRLLRAVKCQQGKEQAAPWACGFLAHMLWKEDGTLLGTVRFWAGK
jgi:hypothetical protein